MKEQTQIARAQNPLAVASNFAKGTESNTLGVVASAGEVARVQAQLVYAASRPRDEQRAVDRMLTAFQRPSLASKALYQYARGGSEVSGLSIRAAEAMAMAWGNMDFGLRELEQKQGESTVEAYAWDLETNVRRAVTFRVPHYRDTRAGRKRLEDSRDIYELVANQGARRVRACILAVLPRDIQEAVETQVAETMKATFEITPESLKAWLEAFGRLGVTKAMLEARIQRRFDSITPAQMMGLANIFNSIKDGVARVEDFFQVQDTAHGGAAGRKPMTLEEKAAAASKATHDSQKEQEKQDADAEGETLTLEG